MDSIRHRIRYFFALPFAQIIHSRLLLERLSSGCGRTQFERTMNGLLCESEELRMLLPQIYYLIYLTLEKDTAGERDSALSCLEKALTIALPDQVYLPFAEHYSRLVPLLHLARIADKTGMADLAALGKRMYAGAARINSYYDRGNTALTAREREIALLAKQGMRNKEIAALLFISQGTVKVTLEKIYRKLEVHSKAELNSRTI